MLLLSWEGQNGLQILAVPGSAFLILIIPRDHFPDMEGRFVYKTYIEGRKRPDMAGPLWMVSLVL